MQCGWKVVGQVAGPRGPARGIGVSAQAGADLDARLLDAIERLAQGRRAFVQDIATRRELSPLQVDLLLTLAEQRRTPPLAGQLARHLDVLSLIHI